MDKVSTDDFELKEDDSTSGGRTPCGADLFALALVMQEPRVGQA